MKISSKNLKTSKNGCEFLVSVQKFFPGQSPDLGEPLGYASANSFIKIFNSQPFRLPPIYIFPHHLQNACNTKEENNVNREIKNR